MQISKTGLLQVCTYVSKIMGECEKFPKKSDSDLFRSCTFQNIFVLNITDSWGNLRIFMKIWAFPLDFSTFQIYFNKLKNIWGNMRFQKKFSKGLFQKNDFSKFKLFKKNKIICQSKRLLFTNYASFELLERQLKMFFQT